MGEGILTMPYRRLFPGERSMSCTCTLSAWAASFAVPIIPGAGNALCGTCAIGPRGSYEGGLGYPPVSSGGGPLGWHRFLILAPACFDILRGAGRLIEEISPPGLKPHPFGQGDGPLPGGEARGDSRVGACLRLLPPRQKAGNTTASRCAFPTVTPSLSRDGFAHGEPGFSA